MNFVLSNGVNVRVEHPAQTIPGFKKFNLFADGFAPLTVMHISTKHVDLKEHCERNGLFGTKTD